MLIFPSFVEGNEPVINLLLLIIEVVFGLDVPEQILKGTNHVSVKSNANHLDQYLVQVLNSRVSFDVSIANWGKWCNHPVHWWPVQTPEV